MHIFEKLPQILGLCPIVKFHSTLEKSDPPNILWTSLNRKILHKLLHMEVHFSGFVMAGFLRPKPLPKPTGDNFPEMRKSARIDRL